MEEFQIGKSTLSTLNECYAVSQLESNAMFPDWATRGEYFSIIRTPDELTIICPRQHIPLDVSCTADWRGLKIEGPFDFNETGILTSIAKPLGLAGISILAISTYDTDYVLIQDAQSESGLSALESIGYQIVRLG